MGDIEAWIPTLRAHLERGQLHGVATGTGICLGPEDDAEAVARGLLAEVDHLANLPAGLRESADTLRRREHLLRDLARLRELLGDRAASVA